MHQNILQISTCSNANCCIHFQKHVLTEDRRRAVSDEAKRLYQEEPNLFEAANKEFKGNHRKFLLLSFFTHPDYKKTFILISYSVELPADARLHDLASFSMIDSKNLDPEQLGLEAIKEQQAAYLKHSSDKCTIIPEDHMHTMLAGVSSSFRIQMCISFLYKDPRTRMLELNQHMIFLYDYR